MGSDPDDAQVREGGKTDSAGWGGKKARLSSAPEVKACDKVGRTSVGDKVKEGSSGGDDEVGTVGGKTVHDRTHAVLANTVLGTRNRSEPFSG